MYDISRCLYKVVLRNVMDIRVEKHCRFHSFPMTASLVLWTPFQGVYSVSVFLYGLLSPRFLSLSLSSFPFSQFSFCHFTPLQHFFFSTLPPFPLSILFLYTSFCFFHFLVFYFSFPISFILLIYSTFLLLFYLSRFHLPFLSTSLCLRYFLLLIYSFLFSYSPFHLWSLLSFFSHCPTLFHVLSSSDLLFYTLLPICNITPPPLHFDLLLICSSRLWSNLCSSPSALRPPPVVLMNQD